MLIQDPIHGYIKLEELERDILDTSSFQRLRRIKQLGFTNLVYPSATHSRFEHSLGTTYLAGKFSEYLELEEMSCKNLKAAAMLHDIGHGPFSHTSEKVFSKKGLSHEDFSIKKIKNSEISSVLEKHGVDPEKVVSLIKGEGELGQLIAGDIDVDRMDYLMRDAHYSGVAHGVIDDETIMRAAEFKKGKLVFRYKFRPALEGLLTARYLMTPTVYMHRAVVRAEKMMGRAIEIFMEYEGLSVEKIAEMDDVDINYRLRNTDCERANFINKMLDQRKVFKPLTGERGMADYSRVEELLEGVSCERKAEKLISDETGVDVKHLIVDISSKSKRGNINVDVLVNDEIKGLEEISSICSSLDSFRNHPERINVYCNEDVIPDVENFFVG